MAKRNPDPAKDTSLKQEVKEATKEAEQQAKTGNVETVKQSEGGPVTDLPTGHRRSLPS